jgi:FlaA1/EpsC-like NDP-sugar epimerase
MDILGRAPVPLDWRRIQASLHDKTILVTGGGGSIGSELCKQLAKAQPRKLIILDQCEFNLYKIDAELTRLYPQIDHLAVLGDVTDTLAVQQLINAEQPQMIFHAAAYKHVPLLEGQVREAVHNNLMGTKIVAEAAIAAGVGRFVLISTDKAVNPTNVMGATKRAAEIVCQNLDKTSSTRFTTVRFGNVLDSAGSVVPLFREQIKAGGPITEISVFEMRRPSGELVNSRMHTQANDPAKYLKSHQAFLLPMNPLEPSTKYTIKLELKISGVAQSKTWAFTTPAKNE